MGVKSVEFKFSPQDYVHISILDCRGRVTRCLIEAGPMNIYSVDYAMNGELKRNEFYEDELEVITA